MALDLLEHDLDETEIALGSVNEGRCEKRIFIHETDHVIIKNRNIIGTSWMELFMTDEHYKFIKGVYHYGDTDIELTARTYFALDFPDSMIIGIPEEIREWGLEGSMCRYYISYHTHDIEFFKRTRGKGKDELIPMLIHNVCARALTILFEGMEETWTIEPYRARFIIPWCNTGADPIS